jgi:hypothetical protein
MRNEELDSMNKEEFRSTKIEGRNKIQQSAIEVLKGLRPVALHQFGSGGKGTSDEFSDLDFFATMRDEDLDTVVANKAETYTKVAPILVRLHNKVPNPAGWYHDLVIHDTDKGLFHVDYYLTPRSKAVLPPNAKLIEGEDNLPTGDWTIDGEADSAGHDLYEAILAMSYIGVKGVVRKWDVGFFDFLRSLYNGYRRDENTNVPELPEKNDFELINAILGNLREDGNEGQKKANKKIQDYTNQVVQLYK